MVAEKHEPEVRVVDRRWWARAEGEPEVAAPADRKPTYVEELERQLTQRAEQLQAFQIEHRRALEEFEQVRVRMRRDVAREVERGRRAVLADLLEVLDNLDRAIASGADADSALLKGVQLVRDQFRSKLQAYGVTAVSAIGQPFDASRHEAVSTAPVDSRDKHGVVIAVVKEGYTIADELLRPASVVVGRFDE